MENKEVVSRLKGLSSFYESLSKEVEQEGNKELALYYHAKSEAFGFASEVACEP